MINKFKTFEIKNVAEILGGQDDSQNKINEMARETAINR